jgi:predicted Rossmann-fold nucleotide-binding protein
MRYDREAEEITRQLPKGLRLAVIGSTSFWGHDSKEICRSVGTQLATLENLILLTGGVSGVGETLGRSFFGTRQQLAVVPNTYHILPRGYGSWDYGITLYGGASMAERREILGRIAQVYLSIEGGPGTMHETKVAQSRGATVVPIGRTGGFSNDIYNQLNCPDAKLISEWGLLNDSSASVELLNAAIRHIVEVLARPDC